MPEGNRDQDGEQGMEQYQYPGDKLRKSTIQQNRTDTADNICAENILSVSFRKLCMQGMVGKIEQTISPCSAAVPRKHIIFSSPAQIAPPICPEQNKQ